MSHVHVMTAEEVAEMDRQDKLRENIRKDSEKIRKEFDRARLKGKLIFWGGLAATLVVTIALDVALNEAFKN